MSEGENRRDGLIRARRHMNGGSDRAPPPYTTLLFLLYYNRGLLAVIFNRRDWEEDTHAIGDDVELRRSNDKYITFARNESSFGV